MIKILFALFHKYQTFLLESAGAGVIIYGLATLAPWAAWVAGGTALLLKSLEVDIRDVEDQS